MSDKDKDSEADAARKRRRARRPATIDLAATEVTEEVAREKAAPGEAEKGAEKGKDGAPERPEAPPETATAESLEKNKAGAGKPEEKKPAPGKKPTDAAGGKASAEPSGPATPDQASAKTAPARRRAGWPLFVGGAVAGGIIALGLYAGLAQLGLVPGLSGNESRLDVRVGNLEMRLAELRASVPEAGDLARATDISELAGRIDALEARPVVDERGDLQPIREEIASLAARLAEAGEMARAARGAVDALTARLAASGENTQSAAAAGAALGERISAAEQTAARAAEAASAAVRGGETAREALRAQMAGEIEARAEVLAERLGVLESKIAALGAQVAAGDSAPKLQAQAALAIAVAGLERAVDSGAPFARELQVVAGLAGKDGADGAEIAALREAAETGVARPGELAEAFPPVATAILDAGEGAGSGAGDRGLVSRLMDNARSLVRVRPTGEVAGDSRAAVVARMEERLSAGDLAGALDEAGALDAPAREAAGDWLARAQASVTARSQARSLAERVAAGLGKADGVAPK